MTRCHSSCFHSDVFMENSREYCKTFNLSWQANYARNSHFIDNVLSRNGYSLRESVTLNDLNAQYLAPLGRSLPENYLFSLEYFVMAKSLN